MDYFKLKTNEAQESWEMFFTSPLIAWKNLDKGPGMELSPEITFHIRKTYVHGTEKIYKTFVFRIFLSTVFLPFESPTTPFLAQNGIQASIAWLLRSLMSSGFLYV